MIAPPTVALGVVVAGNAMLGLVFVVLAMAATFLMFRLWGYPYDKATRTSAAPRWAMLLHRGIGYAFAIVYLVMMWRMVPRLWTYQVEFPARTVAHMVLAITVGFLLFLKIAIIRFFRHHFEEWMPYLGTAILLCTILLVALSLPPFLREHSMAHRAPGGDPFGRSSQERVARLLPDAGLPDGVDLADLSTAQTLRAGRDVLIEKCTGCHDLKTILDKPRTPSGWWTTVDRMGDKPVLFATMTEDDLYRVTAYLIAITPDLQKAAKRRRAEERSRLDAVDEMTGDPEPDQPDDGGAVDVVDAGVAPPAVFDAGPASDGTPSADAGVAVITPTPPPRPVVDPAKAKAVFLRRCSGCHEISDVDDAPPRSKIAARVLVRRMVENGLEASRRDLDLIVWWLDAHYVRKQE